MNDRLAELRMASGTISYFDPDAPSSPEREAAFSRAINADISSHMSLYEPIRASINEIELNEKRLKILQARNRTVATSGQRREILQQLDQVVENTGAHGKAVRAGLEQVKQQNAVYFSQSSINGGVNFTARANMFQQSSQQFRMALERFNNGVKAFREELQSRTLRELKVAGHGQNYTDQQLEAIVQAGQAEQLIEQALVSESLQENVAFLQERQYEIKKLEQQIMEIFQLFSDLNAVVEVQSETLNNIQVHVESARAQVSYGERQLNTASDYLCKVRKRKCILLTIILIVVIVIIAAVAASVSK